MYPTRKKKVKFFRKSVFFVLYYIELSILILFGCCDVCYVSYSHLTVTGVASFFSSFFEEIDFSFGGVELANLLFIRPCNATMERTSDAR